MEVILTIIGALILGGAAIGRRPKPVPVKVRPRDPRR